MSLAILANRGTGKKKRHRPWFGADGATVRLSAHSLVPCPPGSALRIRDRTCRRNRPRRGWGCTYTIWSRSRLRYPIILNRSRPWPDCTSRERIGLWECRCAIISDIQYEAGLSFPVFEGNDAALTICSAEASGYCASRCLPRIQLTIIPDAIQSVFSNCVCANRQCNRLRTVTKQR